MNKKISLGAALRSCSSSQPSPFPFTMIFSRQTFSTTVTNISEREAMYDKLAEIDSYVRKNYYGTIDENNLNDYLSVGYIAGLSDRYAAYYSASDYAKRQPGGCRQAGGSASALLKVKALYSGQRGLSRLSGRGCSDQSRRPDCQSQRHRRYRRHL